MARKFVAAIICTVLATSVWAPAHALSMPTMTRIAADDVATVQYSDDYDQGYGKRRHRSYNERRHHGSYNQRHYDWCEDRYRSYDRGSNSYWARGGQERQCRSPYM